MDEEGDDPFLVETYLTADEGCDLSLCLSRELETDEDGKIRSRLDIQPN